MTMALQMSQWTMVAAATVVLLLLMLLGCGTGTTMTTDFETTSTTTTATAVSGADDHANVTATNSSSSSDQSTTSLKTSVFRDWWCPAGYRLKKRLRVCSQQSCVSTDEGETECMAPTPSYVQCRKILLEANQYAISGITKTVSDTGSVIVMFDNVGLQVPIGASNLTVLIPLGEFVLLRNGTASVCRTNDTSATERRPNVWYTEDEVNELPTSCMPFAMSSDDLQVNASGAALAFNGTKSFRRNFYDDEHRGPSLFNGSVNVCYELSNIETCAKATGLPEEFELMPNMDARETFEGGIVHPLGTYALDMATGVVVYCFDDEDPAGERTHREERRLLYGSAMVVSAVFLFVVLLVHTFFPSLNYHAMVLLCHILSLLLMYTALSISYLSPPNEWSPLPCYALFIVGYVAALGAFFWLNVLAFDLWRTFARMRGTLSPANDRRKRIRFIVQCAYAWGIPSAICAIFLMVTSDSDLQRSLGINEDITFMCWFKDEHSHFFVFYLPIMLILVANVVFFTLTVINLRNAGKGTDVLNKKVNRQLFRVFIKLFIVMGITWFAEVFSYFFPFYVRYYYVTDLINALQGVAIFIVYVCKRSTLQLIRRRTGWCGGAAAAGGSQATQSSSSTQVSNKTGDRKVSADQTAAAASAAAGGAARRSPGTYEMNVVRGGGGGGGGIASNAVSGTSYGTYSQTANVY